MTDPGEPAPTPGASLPATRRGLQRLWLFDTSALVTMAAHRNLHDAVVGYVGDQPRSILRTIAAELEGVARKPPPESTWAKLATTHLSWLGRVTDVPYAPVIETAARVQADLEAASPSWQPNGHWGESVLIALGHHLTTRDATIVIDDYEARLCAERWDVDSISVTRLVRHMTLDAYRTTTQAAAYTAALVACRRWTNQPALSEDDFANNNLRKHRIPALRPPVPAEPAEPAEPAAPGQPESVTDPEQ